MSVPILSLSEWQNLLAALDNPIQRYGMDAVLEAVEYLKQQADNKKHFETNKRR
jgi:hypothetical protein